MSSRRPLLAAEMLDELHSEIGLEALQPMLLSFCTELERRSANLPLPEPGGTRAELRRAAHDLKGMSLSVGAQALGDAADELEQACIAAGSPDVTDLRAQLLALVAPTTQQVNAWLAAGGG